MVIKYRPGKEMLLADGLSRLPNNNKKQKKNKKQKNKEVIDLDVKVDFVQFSTEKLTQIRQATNADPILCELRVRICSRRENSYFSLARNLIRHLISPNQDDLSYSPRAFFTGNRKFGKLPNPLSLAGERRPVQTSHWPFFNSNSTLFGWRTPSSADVTLAVLQ